MDWYYYYSHCCYSVANSYLTLWDLTHCIVWQAALSMGFSMQEYWSWLPFPPLGDLPVPGIELRSLHWQANSLSLTHQESHYSYYHHFIILKPQTKVAAAAANSLQSCPTLCDLIDGSPPGSAIPAILQARTLGGLPFPSLMHESEKWKWSRSVMSNF